jgi:hypothetical protein
MKESVEIRSTEEKANSAPEPTRSGAVRTALTTAAGLAVGAVLTENAQAQDRGPTGGHIRIVVQEGAIEFETLNRAITGVIRQLQPGGCGRCGLLGFDLSILRGDPAFTVGPAGGGIVEGIETVR